MKIQDNPLLKNISDTDTYTIEDHFVYRNGKQIPFIPHDKRDGRETINPKFFVYHYTAGRYGIDGTVNYMKQASTKADVHLVLDIHGNLVQMAPLNEKCWHAGRSSYGAYTGLNSYSAGIEVINPGPMEILQPGIYKTWFGEMYYNPLIVSKEVIDSVFGGRVHPCLDIVERSHQLYPDEPKSAWMPYSKEQLNVMTNLSQAICNHYDAKLVGHDEITNRKRDPGPLSEIERMRDNIEGRSDDVADEEPSIFLPTTFLSDDIQTINTTKKKRGWFGSLFN